MVISHGHSIIQVNFIFVKFFLKFYDMVSTLLIQDITLNESLLLFLIVMLCFHLVVRLALPNMIQIALVRLT